MIVAVDFYRADTVQSMGIKKGINENNKYMTILSVQRLLTMPLRNQATHATRAGFSPRLTRTARALCSGAILGANRRATGAVQLQRRIQRHTPSLSVMFSRLSLAPRSSEPTVGTHGSTTATPSVTLPSSNTEEAVADIVLRAMEIQRLPSSQATSFIDSKGRVKRLFSEGNPWKLSTYNISQKVYRYCWVCGINRFTHKEWNRKRVDPRDESPVRCMNMKCSRELDRIIQNFSPKEKA